MVRVYNFNEIDRIAASYVARYESEGTAKDDTSFVVYEDVSELVSKNPRDALAFIVETLNKSPSNFCLDNLSAGPLENLLARHGEVVMQLIERQAVMDARFRELLGGVSLGRLKPEIAERLVGIIKS